MIAFISSVNSTFAVYRGDISCCYFLCKQQKGYLQRVKLAALFFAPRKYSRKTHTPENVPLREN
jgi:hypothetical protein